MISRMSAAGLAGALSLGLMLTSTETFGRGGGFGGRSFSASPGFRTFGFRAPGHVFSHTARLPFRQHRFGFGVPLIAGGPFVHGYDTPVFSAPAYPPPYVDPDITTGAIPSGRAVSGGAYPVLNYRRGCQTETVTVRLEDPEEKDEVERSINIVRC